MLDSLPTDIPIGEVVEKDIITEVAEATLAETSPPELKPFYISFTEYKKDKCKVDGMESKNAQVALRIIRDIGLDFISYGDFVSKHGSQRLEIKQVFNEAPYDDYYKKLPAEIQDQQEVKEIKFVDIRPKKEVNLRIFYYSLSNIFYMLAITANTHENLDHKKFKQNQYSHKRHR